VIAHNSADVVAEALSRLPVALRVALRERPLRLALRFEEISTEVVDYNEATARDARFHHLTGVFCFLKHRQRELPRD
jgi:hypothetical protein